MGQSQDYKKNLLQSISQKQAQIAIIGLGYVGLPLALRCHDVGFRVLGVDIDVKKAEALKAGRSYIRHIPTESISKIANSDRFQATADFKLLEKADVILICVPTPLGIHQDPDMSYIKKTILSSLPHFRKGQLISLESTTYPGTTEEEISKVLTREGFHVGTDIFVAFSPEREDPGNQKFGTATIPKVVGGVTPVCGEIAERFYGQIINQIVPVSSARVAEMSKLLENIYRSVNIGLVNELKIVCDEMNLNIWEVISAAATKPFGFVPFYPGPGLGGHCIPIDPFYLTWKAKEFGVNTEFIELAGQIHRRMPQWVVQKVTSALNGHSKSLKGSKITILGMAYKKNIDDSRESPSVEILKLLEKQGAICQYVDPYVPVLDDPHFHLPRVYHSQKLTAEVMSKSDCILITTDHDEFPYAEILEMAPLIVDTRGRYREPHPKVVMA